MNKTIAPECVDLTLFTGYKISSKHDTCASFKLFSVTINLWKKGKQYRKTKDSRQTFPICTYLRMFMNHGENIVESVLQNQRDTHFCIYKKCLSTASDFITFETLQILPKFHENRLGTLQEIFSIRFSSKIYNICRFGYQFAIFQNRKLFFFTSCRP